MKTKLAMILALFSSSIAIAPAEVEAQKTATVPVPVKVGGKTKWVDVQVQAMTDQWGCERGYETGLPTIVINEDHPGLVVSISPPPSSRIRFSLDRVDGAVHEEIEWDPQIPGPTARKLMPPFGTYRVSFWVLPMVVSGLGAQGQESLYINVHFNCHKELEKPEDGWNVAGKLFNALPDKTITLPPLIVTIERTQPVQPRVASIVLGASQAESSLRGLSDPVPAGVARVLRLIAEIAIDRAKSRGFKLLRDRIKERLCTRLTWDDLPQLNLANSERVLPETCALIENMRLHDIASAGRPMLASLRGDLEHSVLPVLAELALQRTSSKLGGVQPLVHRLLKLATAAAMDDPSAAREAQLLLTEISRIGWAEIEARTGMPKDLWSILEILATRGTDPFELMRTFDTQTLVKATSAWTMISNELSEDLVKELQEQYPNIKSLIPDVNTAKGLLNNPQMQQLSALLTIAQHVWNQPNYAKKQEFVQNLAFDLLANSPLTEAVYDPFIQRIGTLDPSSLLSIAQVANRHVSNLLTSPSVDEFNRIWALNDPGTMGAKAAVIVGFIVSGGDFVTPWLTEEFGPELACGVKLIVAIANECITRGGCSSSEIADMVANSARHFSPGAASLNLTKTCFADGSVITKLRKKWPTLDVVAERAVFIVQPPRNATSTDMARAAVEITFELLQQLCDDDCDKDELVPQLRRVIDALLDRDPTLVMTRAARLITTIAPNQEKLGQALELVSAFTAYASIKEGDDTSAEQAREARKAAIESLIDSATERSDRNGEWVYSLGVNPGFSIPSWQRTLGTDGANSFERPRLQLPFGVAFQRLPNKKLLGLHLHFMASVLDLGQLVPSSAQVGMDGETTIRDDLDWHHVVSLGGQVGFILGTPEHAFIVGVEARWAPTLFERTVKMEPESGVLRYGFFASYYVPLFDFN